MPTFPCRVAWFVARSGNWDDSLALDPVPFDRVVVNEGSGWGADVSNYYTIPVTGFYMIMLSAGAQSQKRIEVRLYQNDVSIRGLIPTHINP